MSGVNWEGEPADRPWWWPTDDSGAVLGGLPQWRYDNARAIKNAERRARFRAETDWDRVRETNARARAEHNSGTRERLDRGDAGDVAGKVGVIVIGVAVTAGLAAYAAWKRV